MLNRRSNNLPGYSHADVDNCLRMLIDEGALDAVVVKTGSVVTAPWVAFRCQYGCPNFGRCLCCPPHTPTYEQTRKILDSFECAVLFCCTELETVTPLAVKAARQLFLDGYYKALAFGAGPCKKCPDCNGALCRFPGETAPAMEACGIDVFATARANGQKIETLPQRGCPARCFGLILVE